MQCLSVGYGMCFSVQFFWLLSAIALPSFTVLACHARVVRNRLADNLSAIHCNTKVLHEGLLARLGKPLIKPSSSYIYAAKITNVKKKEVMDVTTSAMNVGA
jgi:hypothetical protein